MFKSRCRVWQVKHNFNVICFNTNCADVQKIHRRVSVKEYVWYIVSQGFRCKFANICKNALFCIIGVLTARPSPLCTRIWGEANRLEMPSNNTYKWSRCFAMLPSLLTSTRCFLTSTTSQWFCVPITFCSSTCTSDNIVYPYLTELTPVVFIFNLYFQSLINTKTSYQWNHSCVKQCTENSKHFCCSWWRFPTQWIRESALVV